MIYRYIRRENKERSTTCQPIGDIEVSLHEKPAMRNDPVLSDRESTGSFRVLISLTTAGFYTTLNPDKATNLVSTESQNAHL